MKCKKTYRVLIIWIANISVLFSQVSCTGVFELKLSKFENLNGLNSEGTCCDGIRIDSKCSKSCRTFFRVCLTHYQAHITDDVHCSYAEKLTPVLSPVGSSNVNFDNLPVKFENPIRFPFQFSWPGTFSLILEAWHDNTYNGPTIGSSRDLVYRLGVQRSLIVGSPWQQFTRTNNTKTIEYSYRAQCDEYYYGPGCSNLCRPRDDQFGHYNCDENGTKVCLQGWKGDYCEQAVCLPGCHPDHGFCNKPNECSCRLGYQGKFCDTCVRYPGCLHGTCSEPWQCNCMDGWGGMFCNQDLNFCTHHAPCKNGAICTNTGQGSYTCDCTNGFQGTNCEVEINDCEQQPCSNGGTCQPVGSSFVCLCPEGYRGKRCDTVGVSCDKNPCHNNSTCVESDGGYQCHCRSGYTGFNCDVERNECVSQPCENGGRCVDEVDGFRCVCAAGYSGRTCSYNINECHTQPCLNGGTCLDGDNDFTCRCVAGFVGPLCQVNVPDCDGAPCANGGTCHDLVNDFSCDCAIGWTGQDCSLNINECQSNPCKNGGACKDHVGYYECFCVSGYYGRDCSLSNNQTPQVTQDSNTVSVFNNSYVAKTVQEQEITMTQLVLIVCLGAGIPLLLIIFVVIFFLLRKRNPSSDPIDTSKEQQENVVNNINNKLSETNIFTTNQTSQPTVFGANCKLTNEKQKDFNTYSASGGGLPDKSNHKILLNTKDLNRQQEQYCKSQTVSTHKNDMDKYTNYDPDAMRGGGVVNSNSDFSYNHNASIHIIGKSKAFQRDTDRNSTLFLEQPSVHPHSFLATEV